MSELSNGCRMYLEGGKTPISGLLNALSFLRETLGEASWVGFYVDDGESLKLSYFSGAPACEDISYGKGVVGKCHAEKKDIYVPDVSKFPGYISCDPRAKSETVYFLKKQGKFYVFDIDSPRINGLENVFLELKECGRILLESPLL